jgi:hypothetical protein
MQRGEVLFQQYMFMIGAGYIPRATRTCPATIQRFMHGIQHIRVLPHAEIIIRTPDSHFTTNTLVVTRCARELSAAPFKISENPIPAFAPQAIKLTLEKFFVIHVTLSLPRMIFQVLRLREGRFRPVLPKQGPSPCLG